MVMRDVHEYEVRLSKSIQAAAIASIDSAEISFKQGITPMIGTEHSSRRALGLVFSAIVPSAGALKFMISPATSTPSLRS
jgi:hypothetical protein